MRWIKPDSPHDIPVGATVRYQEWWGSHGTKIVKYVGPCQIGDTTYGLFDGGPDLYRNSVCGRYRMFTNFHSVNIEYQPKVAVTDKEYEDMLV